MSDYKKNAILRGLVVLLIAFVIFSTYVMLTGGGWLSYILPLAATGYGCYSFAKRFYKP